MYTIGPKLASSSMEGLQCAQLIFNRRCSLNGIIPYLCSMKFTWQHLLLAVVFVFAANFDVEAQCAMCKSAAESDLKNDPSSMARNLNTGILYLMTVPYIAIAFIFRKQIADAWRSWQQRRKAGA